VRIFAGEVAALFSGVLSGDGLPSEGAGVLTGAIEILLARDGTGGRDESDAGVLFQRFWIYGKLEFGMNKTCQNLLWKRYSAAKKNGTRVAFHMFRKNQPKWRIAEWRDRKIGPDTVIPAQRTEIPGIAVTRAIRAIRATAE
jgi:hypothetical protein